MNKRAEHSKEEPYIALDLWGRNIRQVSELCESGIEKLKSEGCDLVLLQEVLDENYDTWTENMEWYFKVGYKFGIGEEL